MKKAFDDKELEDDFNINKNLQTYLKDKFKNRIFGLTSYYGDFYTSESAMSITEDLKKTAVKENYPDRLPVKFEITPMSEIQSTHYLKSRDIEKMENYEQRKQINPRIRPRTQKLGTLPTLRQVFQYRSSKPRRRARLLRTNIKLADYSKL